jgi:drug/metabolite transporter (DMT)-like permease
MDFLGENQWLLIAFIAPFFWAVVNVVDVYFVEEVFHNAYDGAIITGFSQIIPFLIFVFVGFQVPDAGAIFFAMLGGFFLVTAYFFYFKTLFVTSDATLIQILWNSLAILVPILAFIFLRERLTLVQYFGIAITFFGAMYLTLNKKIMEKNIKKVLGIMSGAILFFSLMMILTRDVYSSTSFSAGITFFSLGGLIAGIFFYFIRMKKFGSGNFLKMGKKYYKWFLLSEIATLAGVLTSQRAIDVSPSVSFVAAIESFQPAFIVIVSMIIFFLLGSYLGIKKNVVEKIYKEQLCGLGSKIFSIVIMAVGIYMINL